MKLYLSIAGIAATILIVIMLFSGGEDEEKTIPDFHNEAVIIQKIYKPGFAVRKIKHILIYTYGLSQEYDVDYEIVKAMIAIESHWNARALSSANCKGLMQIGELAAKQLQSRKADLNDPYVNITLGILYFSWLQDKYNGDTKKALKAYHEGPGRVDRAGVINFSRDKYVTNVLALAGK